MLGLCQNPTEKGRAVCQFWLQGGKHNVTPTDKNPSDESHPGYLLTYPPFLGTEGDYKVPRKKQPRMNSYIKEILTWLGGGDPDDVPHCHYGSCSL